MDCSIGYIIKEDNANGLRSVFKNSDIPIYLEYLSYYPDSVGILQYLISHYELDLNTKIDCEYMSLVEYMISNGYVKPLEIIRDFYKGEIVIDYSYIRDLDDDYILELVISIIAKTPKDITNLYTVSQLHSKKDIFHFAYLKRKYPDDFENELNR